jgi:hypothetical protein
MERFDSSGLFTATVKATGKPVVVYLTKSGLWCNYQDCTTLYKGEELRDIKAK